MKARQDTKGVALLLVVATIAILSIVLLEFSMRSRLHLQAGANLRDQVRAVTAADTALVLTRACLDPEAWGALKSFQDNVDLESLCGMMLSIFTQSRIDLPIGGLSLELSGVQGIGLVGGHVELQMRSEESFIGLAGLHCAGRGSTGSNCANRKTTARKLRAILCDPSVAEVFESEQEDGHRYTREELIGNLVDWIDPDDNRIQYDPVTNQFLEGTEGEDSYYTDLPGNQRYRSKDAPFDSIEELRMVKGVNETIFRHLKDKVSVHSSGKIDVNTASAQVLATLLRAESGWFQAMENQGNSCGQDSETLKQGEAALNLYVRMIIDARKLKQAPNPLSKPFRGSGGTNLFIKVLQNPLASIMASSGQLAGALFGQVTEDMVLQRYNLTPGQYIELQKEFSRYANNLMQSITTESNLLRVQALGESGGINRRVSAVLKRDGNTVRTLYYREE